MNENVVAEQIKRAYPRYSEVSKDLLRTERMVGNSSYSVTFFDYSPNVLSEDFDIDAYQNKFISAEYYKTEGTLQWNHYLVFVVPKGTLSSNVKFVKRKNEVERNRQFTRKYLVEDSDLSGFLEPRAMVDMVSAVAPESSPYNRWIQQLNSVDLDGLHLGSEYTAIIEGLKTNKVIKERPNSTAITTEGPVDSKINPLNPIEYLKIDDFQRSKPSVGTYPIGRFTMLYGPNGVGKTSFLEALEMVYCGQSARNPKFRDDSLKFAVKYKNVLLPDYYAPTDAQKYRVRDLHWYENRYEGKNRLGESFAKYNFFDTDSAARLSADSGAQKGLVDAFISLSLGDKVNHLEDRMVKFQKMLKSEMNRNDETTSELTTRESETVALITGLQQKDFGLDKEYTLLGRLFLDLGASFSLPPVKAVIVSDFSSRIESSLNSCSRIRNSVPWELMVTPKIILSQMTELGTDLRDFTEYLERQKSGAKAIAHWKGRLRDLSQLMLTAERFERFRILCDTKLIPNLSKNLEALQRRAKGFSSAIEVMAHSNVTEKFKTQSVADGLKDVQIAKASVSKKASDVAIKLQSLQSTLELVNQLINEIRKQSKELLSRSPKLSECPVCLTQHPAGGLKTIVDKLELSSLPAGDILKLLEEKAKCQSEIAEFERMETELRKLHSLEQLLKVEGLPIGKIDDVSEIKIKLDQRMRSVSEQISSLEVISRTLAAGGLSEVEFSELTKILENGVQQFGIERFTDDQIDNVLNKLKTEKATAETELKKLDQPEAMRENLVALRLKLGQMKSDDEVFAELKRRHSQILSAREELFALQTAISISEDREIKLVEQRLQSINQQLIQFRATERAEREKGSVLPAKERELDELKKSITGLKEVRARLGRAFEMLTTIIQSDSKSHNLERFLGTYKHFILKIFTRIHRPVEFSDINIEGSEILLTRIEDDMAVPLTMISTGQRAALALSIFLSLNLSLQKGPPVILIDDPVAHVDDLNTLAFLDYLREIVASGVRQVIFATADSKMAQLIKRKFDFLGGEFLTYPSSDGNWKPVLLSQP